MKKIIFIEDEQWQCDLYKKIFTEAGYEIKTFGNAKRALQIIKQEKPDLILLDLVFLINGQLIMEKSKQIGFNTLRKIKSDPKTKNIPVIIVSNLSDKGEHKAKALALGADDFITKAKILPKELIQRIKKYLSD